MQYRIPWERGPAEGWSRADRPMALSIGHCLGFLNCSRRSTLKVGRTIPKIWALDWIRVGKLAESTHACIYDLFLLPFLLPSPPLSAFDCSFQMLLQVPDWLPWEADQHPTTVSNRHPAPCYFLLWHSITVTKKNLGCFGKRTITKVQSILSWKEV